MKRVLSKIVFVTAGSLAMSACGGAPNKADVTASIKKIMPVNFEVTEVSPVNGISGLFEVLVKVDKQPVVLYVNKSAKLVVSGSIVDVDSKQNLTLEAQKKLMSASPTVAPAAPISAPEPAKKMSRCDSMLSSKIKSQKTSLV